MKYLLWLLKWGLKAVIFITLLAFALENRQDATVRFFFGAEWQVPMVLILLAAFVLGVCAGVLAMLPRWWSQRMATRRAKRDVALAHAAADSMLSQNSISPHGH